MSPETKNALADVCGLIEKKYGKGSILKLTDEAIINKDVTISSGSISLDVALGVGGYRRGRIIEIYGNESSGKTTLSLHAIAEAQRLGLAPCFIDAEHSLDPQYAQQIDVDLSKLLIAQPDYGEQALDIVDMLVRSGEIGIIVVDSVAALIPKAELEGEMGDTHVGRQARMMSQAMRKLAGICNMMNCTVIFINQTRMKIGVMFGSPITTTGGNALKFYASQRLNVSRIGDVKDKDNVTGNKTRVKIVKNKLAPPKKIAEFDISFGIGIDKIGEILDLGSQDGIIEKSGAWYSYKNNKVGQGRLNAIQFLKEMPDMTTEIRQELLENRGLADMQEKDIVEEEK
jgi:recombination protein RecA